MSIPAALRRVVWQRAEYCLISEQDFLAPHEPDHIVATQHGGQTSLENLALACYDCNRPKGPNIASVDPQTGQSVFLFNPRRERWAEHFRLEAAPHLRGTSHGGAAAVQHSKPRPIETGASTGRPVSKEFLTPVRERQGQLRSLTIRMVALNPLPCGTLDPRHSSLPFVSVRP